MLVQGDLATIRAGYFQACTLRDWTVSGAEGDRTVRGTVVDADSYRLQQRPLTFVIVTGSGVVVRRALRDVDVADDVLTARLGPPEE